MNLEYDNGLQCTIRIFKQHKNSVVQYKSNEFKTFDKLAIIVKCFELDGSTCVGLCRIFYNTNRSIGVIPKNILDDIGKELMDQITRFIEEEN